MSQTAGGCCFIHNELKHEEIIWKKRSQNVNSAFLFYMLTFQMKLFFCGILSSCGFMVVLHLKNWGRGAGLNVKGLCVCNPPRFCFYLLEQTNVVCHQSVCALRCVLCQQEVGHDEVSFFFFLTVGLCDLGFRVLKGAFHLNLTLSLLFGWRRFWFDFLWHWLQRCTESRTLNKTWKSSSTRHISCFLQPLCVTWLILVVLLFIYL